MKNYTKGYKPKVSVIMVCLNAAKELEATIRSIVQQSYKNIELVIIDGGSKDDTKKIIKKYQRYIDYFVSEPDKGISDAFNKGIKASSGDFINFQGAGDCFYNKDTIEKMLEGIDPKKDQLVCGKIDRVDIDNKVLYTSGLFFKPWQLLYKMALPHQSLFTNRMFFDKYGLFDLSCKFAMDYEILLRAYKNFPNVILKNVVVSSWKDGGVGANRTREVLAEYDRIRRKNKIAPSWILTIIYLLVKIRYLFVKV